MTHPTPGNRRTAVRHAAAAAKCQTLFDYSANLPLPIPGRDITRTVVLYQANPLPRSPCQALPLPFFFESRLEAHLAHVARCCPNQSLRLLPPLHCTYLTEHPHFLHSSLCTSTCHLSVLTLDRPDPNSTLPTLDSLHRGPSSLSTLLLIAHSHGCLHQLRSTTFW